MLTLAVTYAGLLGGAERTLVDFARGLPGGVVLACPEGALAERARAREADGDAPDLAAARAARRAAGRGRRTLAGHAREYGA